MAANLNKSANTGHMTVTWWSCDLAMMSHVIGTGSAPLLGAGDSCIDQVSAAQSSEKE